MSCFDVLMEVEGVRDISDPGMLLAYRHWAWFGEPPSGWTAKVETGVGRVRYILDKSEGGPGGGSAKIFGPYMALEFAADWMKETTEHSRSTFEVRGAGRDRRLLLLCNN